MADDELITTIHKLVDEEHEIRGSGEPDAERLAHIEVTLDQCWDLLRQRRARRRQPPARHLRRAPRARWSRAYQQ